MKLKITIEKYTGVHVRNIAFIFSFYIVSYGIERNEGVTIVTGAVIFFVLLYLNMPLYTHARSYGVKGWLFLLSIILCSIVIVLMVLNKSYLGMNYSSIFNMVLVLMLIFSVLIPSLLLSFKQFDELLEIIDTQVKMGDK